MPTPRSHTSALDVLLQAGAAPGQLARGWVARVEPNGTVGVHAGRRDPADPDAIVACDRLVVAEGAEVRLARGDVVLYLEPGPGADRGVILGRIGASHEALPVADVGAAAATTSSVPEGSAAEIPEQLVLEARESLVLRVGDGSITLRADGKILIKGRDLVSHAQRLNRIRGGAVSIN